MANPSFTVDDEMLDEFDEVIWQKKMDGDLSREATRSDVLRELIENYIEGNGASSKTATPTTAD